MHVHVSKQAEMSAAKRSWRFL